MPNCVKVMASVGWLGLGQFSCSVYTTTWSTVLACAKSTRTQSGYTSCVPSAQPPPLVQPAPVVSPLITAATGNPESNWLQAVALAPFDASATFVVVGGGWIVPGAPNASTSVMRDRPLSALVAF